VDTIARERIGWARINVITFWINDRAAGALGVRLVEEGKTEFTLHVRLKEMSVPPE
jgi:hypothetical protein